MVEVEEKSANSSLGVNEFEGDQIKFAACLALALF